MDKRKELENSKDWKLFRCIYDEMGQHAIEGEGNDKRFEQCVEDGYGSINYLIGEPIEHNGHTIIKVILEASKPVLEYILGLEKKNQDLADALDRALRDVDMFEKLAIEEENEKFRYE